MNPALFYLHIWKDLAKISAAKIVVAFQVHIQFKNYLIKEILPGVRKIEGGQLLSHFI